MFPVHSTFGFASGYQQPCLFVENASGPYAQGYFGVPPNTLGDYHAPVRGNEASPWAWQWSEELRTQEGPLIQSSNTATITQPRVQPTYGVDQAPLSFSRVVGGPVRPVHVTCTIEVDCPRPVYPLPAWIDTTGWEGEEDDTTPGEDDAWTPDQTSMATYGDNDSQWDGEEEFGERFGAPCRFLPTFLLSPDPEELPAPFFPPSRDAMLSPRTPTSLFPDARELPQPRFDADPHPPLIGVSSWMSTPGVDLQPLPRFGSPESIMSPDPEDLPPPNFGIHTQFKFGRFGRLRPPECYRGQPDEGGGPDYTGRGPGEAWWEVVMGRERSWGTARCG